MSTNTNNFDFFEGEEITDDGFPPDVAYTTVEEIIALHKSIEEESIAAAAIENEKKNNLLLVEKIKNSNNDSVVIDKSYFNALELYNFETTKVPKLLDPFLQTIGLASLVGTSDSGKSTFLRQLSLSIALNLNNFIGFPLKSKHNKVIYVSTEDDVTSISYALRLQINHLKKENKLDKLEGLQNLDFIFDTDNLHKNLTKRLEENPVDLIIIDAFTDVFTKEINANTQVRTFLNEYDKLAKKHKCLILFLHHTGKRTANIAPTKESILGSQGFEAKMRVVLELRPNNINDTQKDLWVLKSNFLDSKYKRQSYTLEFSKDLTFSNTGFRGGKQVNAKSNNTDLTKKIIELHNQGLSYRKIENKLKLTEFKISKSAIAEIINKNKK